MRSGSELTRPTSGPFLGIEVKAAESSKTARSSSEAFNQLSEQQPEKANSLLQCRTEKPKKRNRQQQQAASKTPTPVFQDQNRWAQQPAESVLPSCSCLTGVFDSKWWPIFVGLKCFGNALSSFLTMTFKSYKELPTFRPRGERFSGIP